MNIRPYHEPARAKQPLSPTLSPLLRRGARENDSGYRYDSGKPATVSFFAATNSKVIKLQRL